MKRNVSQAGSLSAIIISVLFVALMAALGVIFYQNFIQEKPAQKAEPAKEEPTGNTMKTARVAFDGVIYALDYPDNWKEAREPAGNENKSIEGTKLNITSPSGKVEVRFQVDAGSASSACDKSDGRKVSYYNTIPKANLELTGTPLTLVEALYDHLDGGYDYVIGLAPDSGATHAAVGNPACNVISAGVVYAYRRATDEKPAQPRMFARIIFPQHVSEDGKPSAPHMDPLKELMATDEYKAAVKVLESARKE